MMQVVILAAGRGTRLIGEVAKPLMKIHGMSMLSYSVRQAHEVTNEPVVICNYAIRSAVANIVDVTDDNCTTIIDLNYVQNGAAMTLLAATAALDENEPVMVTDCDTIFSFGVMKKFSAFADHAFNNGMDSAVLCFKPTDNSDRYSFVELINGTDPAGFVFVIDVREKERISDVATCGVHAFSSWRVLREAICGMVMFSEPVKGEWYLAPVHDHIKRTAAMIIEANEFHHVGTTAELEAYEQTVSKAE